MRNVFLLHVRTDKGVTVAAFERGRPMAWDATVIHTCASTHLHVSPVTARAAANAGELRKSRKDADSSERYDLRPVGMVTLGAFGPQALELVDTLSARIFNQSADIGTRSRILRRLADAIPAGSVRRMNEAQSGEQRGRFNTAL